MNAPTPFPDGTMTSREWACWALFGSSMADIPPTLQDLHERVAQAVLLAVRDEREACARDIEDFACSPTPAIAHLAAALRARSRLEAT